MTSMGPLASSVPHSIVDTVPKQLSVSPSYGLSVFGKSSFLRHTWVRTSLQTLAEAPMAFRVTPILYPPQGINCCPGLPHIARTFPAPTDITRMS